MTPDGQNAHPLDNAAIRELSTIERRNARLPHQPWAMLPEADMLEGFGGPLADNWVVMRALVKDGVIWHQPSETAFGPYPYPEEMRFGPRSVTKSVTAPLALGRLSQKYGPFILNLKIGDLLDGLDPEYAEVRLLDAANMATGMGGAGSLRTAENDDGDGYVDATYDDWYNGAPSHQEKLDAITRDASPYPWGPGVVMRYRDRDYHLLGAALDAFVKQVEGPNADICGLLEEEVFNPIGIATAPIVRTIEPDGSDGLPWFHAGYYPTMDDMAKIAQLYHNRGLFEGEQLLHPEVIEQLFSTNGAIPKSTDLSWQTAFTGQAPQPAADGEELYKMGMHLVPHRDAETGELVYLPAMFGFSSNQIILYPGELTSMRFAKAWPMPGPEWETTGHENTIAAVNRLGSFSK